MIGVIRVDVAIERRILLLELIDALNELVILFYKLKVVDLWDEFRVFFEGSVMCGRGVRVIGVD